jgi:hypothetical protein
MLLKQIKHKFELGLPACGSQRIRLRTTAWEQIAIAVRLGVLAV